jgi:hypothetical protein
MSRIFRQIQATGLPGLLDHTFCGIQIRRANSFPDDGGKTWEVNWITDQTRVKDTADKTY